MSSTEAQRPPNHAITTWGVLGFTAILGQAIYRLTPLALHPIRHGMTGFQVGLYVVWVVWMWWSEGYRAFQKQLAPRFVKRAVWLARDRRPLYVALAPIFCLGLFHARRRRLIISWSISLGVICLIIAVRFLPMPWRGIVDGGVVVGLAWGVGWILYYFAVALAGGELAADPELPE